MNYEDKFKDRTPEETIEIIKTFFKNRGMKLRISMIKSEIGTYSHQVKLIYNNEEIAHSNGKGVTEAFSLASGLSELYERFCNIPFFINTIPAYQTFLNIVDNEEIY